MFEQYKRIAFRYANTVYRKHSRLLDLSALESAALEGLAKAEATYNPDSTAAPQTWAFIHARKAVQDEARRQRPGLCWVTTARAASSGTLSRDGDAPILDLLPDTDSSLADQALHQEQVRDLLMAQIRKLPAPEQRVLVKFLAGMSQTDISQKEGCTKQHINKIWRNAVQLLRARLRGLELHEAAW